MSESVSEWMKGVRAALKANGFSEDNNIARGMAVAMRGGKSEESMTYDEGYEIGVEVAKRCKYGKR